MEDRIIKAVIQTVTNNSNAGISGTIALAALLGPMEIIENWAFASPDNRKLCTGTWWASLQMKSHRASAVVEAPFQCPWWPQQVDSNITFVPPKMRYSRKGIVYSCLQTCPRQKGQVSISDPNRIATAKESELGATPMVGWVFGLSVEWSHLGALRVVWLIPGQFVNPADLMGPEVLPSDIVSLSAPCKQGSWLVYLQTRLCIIFYLLLLRYLSILVAQLVILFIWYCANIINYWKI